MKSSYKFALLGAAVLCVLAIAFAVAGGDGDGSTEAVEPVVDQPAQPARQTLLRSTPPQPAASPAKPAPQPARSPSASSTAASTPAPAQQNDFLADLRARMAAAENLAPTAEAASEPAMDEAPIEPASPAPAPEAAPVASAAPTAPTASPAPTPAQPVAAAPAPVSAPATANTRPAPSTTSASANRPVATTASSPSQTNTSTATNARTYTVRSGDTLAAIAGRLYGSEQRWVQIAQANPRIDPLKLKVGQELRLPTAASLEQTLPRGDTMPAPSGTLTYTVRPGDTLSAIARRFYSEPGQWRVIYNANRDRIGSNPNALQAGERLVIPPAPRGNG